MYSEERIAHGAVVAAALVLVLRSLVLVCRNFFVPPWYDQWNLVVALAADPAAVLTPGYVLGHHNEHIIATSQPLFLLDYRFFQLRNVLPVAAVFVLQIVLAGLLAAIACGDTLPARRWSFWALSAVAMSSIAQWQNLLWGYQAQFPLCLVFGVLAIRAYETFLAAPGTRRGRFAWLAAALAMGLCVVSFGAGVLVGVPLLFMSLVTRATPRRSVPIVIPYALLCVFFFSGLHESAHIAENRQPIAGIAAFALAILGSPFAGNPTVAIVVGVLGVTAWAALAARCVVLPWRRRTSPDRRAIVLVAIGVFMLAFVGATAWGRAFYFFGVSSLVFATTSRYATPAFVFWMGVVGLLFRLVAREPWSEQTRSSVLSVVVVVVLLGLGFSTFRPDANRVMQHTARLVESAAFLLLNDVPAEPAVTMLDSIEPEKVRVGYQFLRQRQLGMFAPAATWYRPPSLTGDPATYPACDRGWMDKVERVAPGGWLADGWVSGSEGALNPEWVLAFDGDGRRVGFTRVLTERPDVAEALQIDADVLGFSLPIRLADGAAPDARFTVVAVDGRAACRLVDPFAEAQPQRLPRVAPRRAQDTPVLTPWGPVFPGAN